MERLAKLQPAFKSDGTVTAGNSSGIKRRRGGAPALRGADGGGAWACSRWRGSSHAPAWALLPT